MIRDGAASRNNLPARFPVCGRYVAIARASTRAGEPSEPAIGSAAAPSIYVDEVSVRW